MKLILDKQCTLSGADQSITGQSVKDRIKQALTMKNPAYIEAKKYERWTGNIDKTLCFFEETEDGSLLFPRGFLRQALILIRAQTGIMGIPFQDNRHVLDEIFFKFTGKLRPYQDQALQALLKKDFGVLEALMGSGKTVIALAVIAARRQPTLILVHTKLLLDQWCERIKTFLSVDAGRIGGGQYDIQPITVGIINSVWRHLDELPSRFGQIIGDENHKIPTKTYSDIVKAFDCKYMLGLSATPYRRDGLTNLIHWYVGPLVHKIDPKELEDTGAVLVPEIIYKQTDFHYNFRDDYAKMLSVLTQDEPRNAQIAQDVLREAGTCQETVLVVSDRVKHCLALKDLLLGSGLNLNIGVLTGQTKAQERMSFVEDIRAGKVDIVIATVQLIGEGIDFPGLSSLFLATPIRFEGRIVQVIGRILRPADGKQQPRVYDYQDPISIFYASARSRRATYKKMNWLK